MKKHLLILAMAATFSSQPALSAEIDVSPVVKHYASLVYANYEDTLTSAKAMQGAINAFLANPRRRPSAPRNKPGATRASSTVRPRRSASMAARSTTTTDRKADSMPGRWMNRLSTRSRAMTTPD
jgi:hypothetical protein